MPLHHQGIPEQIIHGQATPKSRDHPHQAGMVSAVQRVGTSGCADNAAETMPAHKGRSTMSFHDHKTFERAFANPEAGYLPDQPGAARAPGRKLPLWLVDPAFDEAMRRNAQSVVQDDERLPLPARAGILALVTVAAWVPVLAIAALIW
jgi:hypothetical protein